MAAVKEADPTTTARVAAIDEPNVIRPYPSTVRWRIRQGAVESYRAAAESINESNADIVNIQHEFGLYGVWGREENGEWSGDHFEDHLTPFLTALTKPSVVTFHTVLPHPSPSVRAAVRSIVSHTDGVVVMATTAIELLRKQYGITSPITLIHHGMPAVQPIGRRRLKEKLGLQGRTLISTFGLVDPRKGLEYMIEAVHEVVKDHPKVLYLIAGQTHPELLRRKGEEYRNSLMERVTKLGLDDHVGFVNQYMTQKDIIEYLLASDVYVTPYLDPNQITSGTLSYALGAGKAIISTPYLHAIEALADGRGILVDFRSSEQLVNAIIPVLDNPEYKAQLEGASYEYSKMMTWPESGKNFRILMQGIVDRAKPARQPERRKTSSKTQPSIVTRHPRNPLLVPSDVTPSNPQFEAVCVLNAGTAVVGDETLLLVRVAERPRLDLPMPRSAQTLIFEGVYPHMAPLPTRLRARDVVATALYDVSRDPAPLVPLYIDRNQPGLDLSDPRIIRMRTVAGGFGSARDDFADVLTQVSHLRLARSRDGVRFHLDQEPFLAPTGPYEEYGLEDPRITKIGDRWYITYVAVSRMGMATALASTQDFVTVKRHGTIFLPDHKDVVLFPEKVNGRYVALTRPMPQSFARVHAIWIAYSDDLVNWGGHQTLAVPRPGMWDGLRVGASAPPIRTSEGWLEIYHGVDSSSRYCLGSLLLDLDDPSHVIGRSSQAFLSPEEPYEKNGLFANTVFSCGVVPLDEDGTRLRIFYGAADTCIAAADVNLADILARTERC